jgi:hypothetical protein
MTLPDGLRHEGIVVVIKPRKSKMVRPSSAVSMTYRASDWSTPGVAPHTGISAISTGG